MKNYVQCYVHLVWSTWDRLPLITAEVEPQIHGCLAAKCRELGCNPLAIGGVADHVHLLVEMPTTVTIARLVNELKGASSHVRNHSGPCGPLFRWQRGYGAFTVSAAGVPRIRRYIRNQRTRHADHP